MPRAGGIVTDSDAARREILRAVRENLKPRGIAETGTLVLESARERSRLLSLVPPIHVAVLSTRCICESLGDALARVRQGASHAITFITGPSRTSDIELTLVVGVHGPQTVHVLLLEET